MESMTMTMSDYVGIVKRRKWSLILPAFIILLTAGIVSLALPSIYKSTSTILIEEKNIPDEFVKATVTSYAEQRLQSILQRIVSFSRLVEIINRFNLYPDLKEKWTTEEIVHKMKKDIFLEPISSEIVDRHTGRPSERAIAFTLSYAGKDPGKVQRVANLLASLFLEENLQERERQASETADFLEKEMDKVKEKLSELEVKLAAFKEAHINELPDLLQVNTQSLNNIESNIERSNQQLRNLKEREGYLQSQLSSVSPMFEEEKRDKQRLDELKVQLVHLKSRYSDQYPDVIKTKTEIVELEKQLNDSDGKSDNPGHSDDPPDNPAYITLASQLSSTQADIESVKRQLREFNKMASKYRDRIANTPRVEGAYKAILTERDNTQAKYDDLMRKHMESKVTQGLEKEQKGERFTLIDPARVPEKPYKPNRKAIALMGIVLSIGAGIGWASLREFTDHSVRDSETLTLATSFPVLAGIPEIVTDEDLKLKKRKQTLMIIAVLLSIAVGLVVFHYMVMDLNVFWAKLMRKIAL
jgi:polysaccharide chain length determinant protein (PEP-CTERM system associated)